MGFPALSSDMRRRLFLQRIATPVLLAPPFAGAVRRALAADPPEPWITAEQALDWRTRWEKEILGNTRTRYCDKETGEELGWLVSPFLEGFYQGYLATRDAEWVARLVEWMDACVRRATKEPDGFPGWPKGDGGGDDSTEFSADSLLGEAMMLRPAVLMADARTGGPVRRRGAHLHQTRRGHFPEMGHAQLLAQREGRRAVDRARVRH